MKNNEIENNIEIINMPLYAFTRHLYFECPLLFWFLILKKKKRQQNPKGIAVQKQDDNMK